MAKSNRNRVGDALEVFTEGMVDFVIREMKARHKDQWQEKLREIIRDNPSTKNKADQAAIQWDTALIITVIIKEWQYNFSKKLGQGDRAMIHELSDVRNKWAHQSPFSLDDTIRALDTIHRLLNSVGAAGQAAKLDQIKSEVMRLRFAELQKKESKKASQEQLQGQPSGGLKPWREIVTPHRDVASGRFAQAEFAADLAQVLRGGAAKEYEDPVEFFRRTFITEGLKELLLDAITRLSNQGGDPVVELQTNFGGGKTHSMLALYHMFSGISAADLAGVDELLKSASIEKLPKASRAVIVGTALSAGQSYTKEDGTEVNTLWGEIAYQLLGNEGYAIVEDCDKNGIAPGSDILTDLFKAAGPSLILIDEWVAYIRQTYETPGLPGGSFDNNLTFAQSLTEAAKHPQVLVVASLPQSQIEVGGEGGQNALDMLQNTFTRVKSSWRPATQEESYEIVRRRLFEPIPGDNFAARDAVIEAFAKLYLNNDGEFPIGVKEADYIRKMEIAYPVHPELFERLYGDWSSLEEFQRTRGVLRLMACAIHSLWEGDDKSLMILPAMIPMDDQHVLSEITTKSGLSPAWTSVIEKDVDGGVALSRKIDADNPNLGRFSACRRVARTIYMGSAPLEKTANRGVDDRRIKLGCVQPGENVPIFGDALRRLTDQATHLYVDGNRYWYSTQPSVSKVAQDRAAQQGVDEVMEEIRRRLRKEQRNKADFSSIHPCPDSSSDVEDAPETRLVILKPEISLSRKSEKCSAIAAAKEILEQRGNSPRINRNALVFLAADKSRKEELESAVRSYLAWKSIYEEREPLNLDAFQTKQAETKKADSDKTVDARILEAYQWLIIPQQTSPTSPIQFESYRLTGIGELADRAAKKMIGEELMLVRYAGIRLRMDLDKVPLWRGDHVKVKELSENFSQYTYLPRLKNEDVLFDAINDGVANLSWKADTFAFAQNFDEEAGRYKGLSCGTNASVYIDSQSLIVKSEIADKQRAADQLDANSQSESHVSESITSQETETIGENENATSARPETDVELANRFFGSVEVDATRLGRDAGRIATEVIAHLTGLQGSQAEITIEIQVKIPQGVPGSVVRTVNENCNTLKFKSHGFETE